MAMNAFMIFSLAVLLALSLPAFAEQVTVRDRNGKIIRIERTDGNTTTVRDPHGKLIEKRIRRGDRIEVRDAGGRLLRTETIK